MNCFWNWKTLYGYEISQIRLMHFGYCFKSGENVLGNNVNQHFFSLFKITHVNVHGRVVTWNHLKTQFVMSLQFVNVKCTWVDVIMTWVYEKRKQNAIDIICKPILLLISHVSIKTINRISCFWHFTMFMLFQSMIVCFCAIGTALVFYEKF